MPEVFAPPPYVFAGCLCEDVRNLFRLQRPLAWHVIKSRRIFVEQLDDTQTAATNSEPATPWKRRLAGWTSSQIFDRLWRAPPQSK